MSTVPQVVTFDCLTGESVYRDMTPDELANAEAQAIVDAENKAVREAEISAAEAARESARAKLAALGLTEAEVAALVK